MPIVVTDSRDLPDVVWVCFDSDGTPMCVHADEDELIDCDQNAPLYGLARRRKADTPPPQTLHGQNEREPRP